MSFAYGFGLPHYQTLSGGFSPLSLFGPGQIGAWYDPSDFSTLFQDSAGTTPVTAVEQVVGLMLDKSQGLVLGPELVTNGDFSSGTTGWTQDANALLSVVGGSLRVENGSALNSSAYQSFSTTSGVWCKATVQNTGATNLQVRVGTAAVGSQNYIATISAGTTSTFYFAATAATTFITIRVLSSVLGDFVSVDNISVKALPGYHATATGTARPTLSARVNLLTKTEQFQDAAWIKITSGTGSIPVVTPNAAVAPDGTTTADLVVFDRGAGNTASDYSWLYQATGSVLTSGAGYTGLCYIKAATVSDVGKTLAFRHVGGVNAIITLTADWQTVSVNQNALAASGTFDILNRGATTTGNSVSALLWGADLRVTNDGVNIPPYQRVNTATDYDTAGFPLYLSFAGAQAMSTPASIPFATVTSDGQARRNLFSNPTQFDVSASWPVTRASVTANATTAPDGSSSADKIVEDTTASATHSIQYVPGTVGTIGAQETLSVYAKPDGRNWILLQLGSSNLAYFDVSTGAVGTISGSTVATISGVGNGWYRCSISAIRAGNQNNIFYCSPANGTITYTGDGTSGLFLWGAQLETGSTATAFQNIGTDKMLVCAGVRKLSDAARGVLVELSPTIAGANGVFLVDAPSAALNNFAFTSRGTSNAPASSVIAAPITRVLSGIGDIGGDISELRLNGVSAATSTADQGTGNYISQPLYLGARGGSSLFFNGRIYGLVIAGSQYTAGQVSATEAYMNSKTAAYV